MQTLNLSKEDKRLLALAAVCIILAACFFMTACDKSSDSYVRDRVLYLKSEKGACTGIQVKAPSGAVYTLTAGHCVAILDEDRGTNSIDEQGREKRVYMLDIDESKDLMLLTSPNYRSIDVAISTSRHEHVHTPTHGHIHATYRTDGELLEMQDVHIPENIILTPSDEAACKAKPNHEVYNSLFDICVKTMHEMMTTAIVFPGSSGGPVLDSSGKLVGIVSVTEEDTIFSGTVPLDQIHEFLKDR